MFHTLNKKEVLKKLKSSEKGLTSKQAEKRRKTYGKNIIKKKEEISPTKIFLEQFKSFIVYILIFAIFFSFLTKNYIEAIVIIFILIANAILGFIQEFKAEKAIEALKKLTSLQTIAIRDGEEKLLHAEELVPGDIIHLDSGSKVPADAYILEAFDVEVDEAILTGESIPVQKKVGVTKSIKLHSQSNMLFSGTILTRGKAIAIITNIGMKTEVGKIAKLIQETKSEKTPLQKRLAHFGKNLGLACIAIAIIIFLTGLFQGKGFYEMFLAAISLAVAAVPEGLPAVVTIALALGVQKLIKVKSLVRKLSAVETLGSTSVICADKTGTFTKGEMTVTKIFTDNEVYNITGTGYDLKGDFLLKNKKINPRNFSQLLKIGASCNDSTLNSGDPTERALLVLAKKAQINPIKRISEVPFSPEKKFMITTHQEKNKKFSFMKGAPEVILKKCTHIDINGKVSKLNENKKKEILKVNEKFAEEALRVLALAYSKDKNFIFKGLTGMIDPPRKEVKNSLNVCKKANIKVVMITGDHPTTAKAIAKKINLNGEVITGEKLEKISDKEIINYSVFARVNPEDKVRILKAFKGNDKVIAMTGDGVNDAPALKKADIGIAMGTGTDVAKEAAEMILIDDNFVNIQKAIKEGRVIFDNIQKFVTYLLSSNMGELLTVFFGILLGLPLPVLALQILWINLITDGLPALALSKEPAEKDIMKRKPRKNKDGILDSFTILNIIFVGLIMAIGTLFLFNKYQDLTYARSIAFSTLVFFQMFNVLNNKSEHESIFKIGLFSNMYLIGAILISILLQLIVIYSPLNHIFKAAPILPIDWLWITLTSFSVIVVVELRKIFWRRSHHY